MSLTEAYGYDMLRRCGRNRDRYEVIRPDDYQDPEEPVTEKEIDQ